MIEHNITYPISSEIVDVQIASACERHEATRARLKEMAVKTRETYQRSTTWTGDAPQSDEAIDAMINKRIDQEQTHYATVRVVRLAGRPDTEKSYVLVYGEADDAKVGSGTGPFATLVEAIGWFINGGR